MKEHVSIEIAKKTLGLRFNDIRFKRILDADYRPFFSRKPARMFLDLLITTEMYNVHTNDTGLSFADDVCWIREEYIDGIFDFKAGHGLAKINAQGLPWALSHCLRNIFVLLLAVKGDALIFHASVIVKKGKGYIFIGPSGSGKTTASKLSGDCTVLSDDLAIVMKTNGAFSAFPTPCWQDFSCGKKENKPYPVAGIFKLAKDKEAYVKRIPRPQAVMELFTIPHVAPQFLSFDGLIEKYYGLLHRSPLYELHFRKDNTFWRCIHGLKK